MSRACASGVTLLDRPLVNCSPFVWDGSPPGTAGQGLTLSASLPPSLPFGGLFSAARRQAHGPFWAPERLGGGPGALPSPRVCCLAPRVPCREGGWDILHVVVGSPDSCVQGAGRGGPCKQQLPQLPGGFLERGFPPGGPAHWGGLLPTPHLLACFNTDWAPTGDWPHSAFQTAGQVCEGPASLRGVGVRGRLTGGAAWTIIVLPLGAKN